MFTLSNLMYRRQRPGCVIIWILVARQTFIVHNSEHKGESRIQLSFLAYKKGNLKYLYVPYLFAMKFFLLLLLKYKYVITITIIQVIKIENHIIGLWIIL